MGEKRSRAIAKGWITPGHFCLALVCILCVFGTWFTLMFHLLCLILKMIFPGHSQMMAKRSHLETAWEKPFLNFKMCCHVIPEWMIPGNIFYAEEYWWLPISAYTKRAPAWPQRGAFWNPLESSLRWVWQKFLGLHFPHDPSLFQSWLTSWFPRLPGTFLHLGQVLPWE